MWYRSIESWKTVHHVFCNNCSEFRRLGKFFFFNFFYLFVCLLLLLIFFFFFLEVKTWKVKCYSLRFCHSPICNWKNLHRIEHSKHIKQGQECQKVIAKKSLRIYINIFIYHHCFFSLWSARFLQSLKHVVLKSEIMKNISPCLS